VTSWLLPHCPSLSVCPSAPVVIMRTVAKCLALVALAEVAAAFAPSANLALRKTSPGAVAACPARPFQAAPRRARTAQLRAAGVQMSVTNIPITITGTNIEVNSAPPFRVLHFAAGRHGIAALPIALRAMDRPATHAPALQGPCRALDNVSCLMISCAPWL
jgi:hypothetical protein